MIWNRSEIIDILLKTVKLIKLEWIMNLLSDANNVWSVIISVVNNQTLPLLLLVIGAEILCRNCDAVLVLAVQIL